jgi:hypothetical protein
VTVTFTECVLATYQIAWHHIPEGTRIYCHNLEKPKSQTAHHELFIH